MPQRTPRIKKNRSYFKCFFFKHNSVAFHCWFFKLSYRQQTFDVDRLTILNKKNRDYESFGLAQVRDHNRFVGCHTVTKLEAI